MAQRALLWVFAAAGFVVGCRNEIVDAKGAGGAGAGAGVGGEPSVGGDPGVGGDPSVGGGPMVGTPCGDQLCNEDQDCTSCTWDDGSGESYDCKDVPAPGEGEYSCAYDVCLVGTYCELLDDDICDGNQFSSCLPLPSLEECPAQDCSCFADDPCLEECTDGGGHIEVRRYECE
jgi:hypothetical protein